MNPASAILLDLTAGCEVESCLVLGGESDLPVGLAEDHPKAIVHWQPVDYRDRRAVADSPMNVTIQWPGETVDAVDAVVIAATPDRRLTRRWLLMARNALVEGGRTFVAGANDEGIRSVIGDAAKLFGAAMREDYRSKHRIAVFAWKGERFPDPGWASESGVLPGSWQEFPFTSRAGAIRLVTQPGVFAGDRVDPGTQMLLDVLPDHLDGRVLDIGCGVGVIGIAAAVFGADAVDMTDVSLLAIQAAQENLRRLSKSGDHGGSPLPTIRAFASDVFSAVAEERYDLIVSNPPFHRGKAIDYTVADRLIAGAPKHLADTGSLLIVANSFLAFGKRMERVFGTVESIAANRQYHVLRASQPR